MQLIQIQILFQGLRADKADTGEQYRKEADIPETTCFLNNDDDYN